MTIKYYKITITDFPQKDEIICDADLHNKFRNNPHEKMYHYFYEVKQQSDSTARSVV